MGLLDRVLGNATASDKKEAESLVMPLLVPGETVSHAFHIGARDMLLFTQFRFVFVDKQGLTGKKQSIMTYPWSRVQSWGMTTAGHFDIDSELVIELLGTTQPMHFTFGRSTDIRDVAKTVGLHVLK